MATLPVITRMKRMNQRTRKASSPSMTSSSPKCVRSIVLKRCGIGNMAFWGRPSKSASAPRFHKTYALKYVINSTKTSQWRLCHSMRTWNMRVTRLHKMHATEQFWRAWFKVSVWLHCDTRQKVTHPIPQGGLPLVALAILSAKWDYGQGRQ